MRDRSTRARIEGDVPTKSILRRERARLEAILTDERAVTLRSSKGSKRWPSIRAEPGLKGVCEGSMDVDGRRRAS